MRVDRGNTAWTDLSLGSAEENRVPGECSTKVAPNPHERTTVRDEPIGIGYDWSLRSGSSRDVRSRELGSRLPHSMSFRAQPRSGAVEESQGCR